MVSVKALQGQKKDKKISKGVHTFYKHCENKVTFKDIFLVVVFIRVYKKKAYWV